MKINIAVVFLSLSIRVVFCTPARTQIGNRFPSERKVVEDTLTGAEPFRGA